LAAPSPQPELSELHSHSNISFELCHPYQQTTFYQPAIHQDFSWPRTGNLINYDNIVNPPDIYSVSEHNAADFTGEPLSQLFDPIQPGYDPAAFLPSCSSASGYPYLESKQQQSVFTNHFTSPSVLDYPDSYQYSAGFTIDSEPLFQLHDPAAAAACSSCLVPYTPPSVLGSEARLSQL